MSYVDLEKGDNLKRPDTPEDGLDPVIDNELNIHERRFLLSAERGDLASVRKDLVNAKKDGIIDVNCTDHLGRTALVIAIYNENLDLMQLLLNAGVDPGDSLLHAVSEEYVEGVEFLLDWEEAHHTLGQPYSWETVQEKVATFNTEVTPLIMAAQRNNYEILSILLKRGASLPLPHNVKCGCDECLISQKEDSLRHSRSRITSYQAMACPSLICLASRDPILSAFELSSELRSLSSIDTEFRCEYINLRKNVQTFTKSILDHTRTSSELEILLNYDPKGSEHILGERMGFERLKLAIQHQQKEFVAHANVQQMLATIWYDGMPGFRRKSMLGQLKDVVAIAASFPIYSTMYMIAPHSSWGQRCRKPFVKFIIHSSSYMFFLTLLVMVSQRVESMAIRMFGPPWLNEWQDERERKARGALPNIAEMGVIMYIMGFLWAEIRQLWDGGIQGYFEDMWNIVDFGANWFYVNWLLLRITSFIIVWREQLHGIDPWKPKEHWHPYDPMFISEGMYGAATIISFLKLIHIVSVNEHLGPLQISLGRMIFDIIKFMCLVMLVVFSFGCGLNQMLYYYAETDMHLCYSGPGGTVNDEYENSCEIWRRFSNLFETSQTLFWAVFGMIEIGSFELTGIQEFTRFWTLLMFGSYSAINIVVLLNLLIAMMSNSYNIIFERSDLEWKFSRSKLWMSYFDDGSTLPAPFNIVPTPKSFLRLFRDKKVVRCNTIRRKEAKKRDKHYYSTMRSLVKRYVCYEQRHSDDSGVSTDDINEVKQDINTFRYQLFDILRRNGMKSIDLDQDGGGGGRKQVEKERRLMKGFNIGLVENADFSLNSGESKAANVFAKILMGSKRKQDSKKDWNRIVRQSTRHRNHIGSSRTSFENARRRSNRLSSRRERSKSIAVNPIPQPYWKKVQFMKNRGAFHDGSLDQPLVNKLLSTDRRLSTGWGRVQALQLRGALAVDPATAIPIDEEDERRASVCQEPSNNKTDSAQDPRDVKTSTTTTTTTTTDNTTPIPGEKPATEDGTDKVSTVNAEPVAEKPGNTVTRPSIDTGSTTDIETVDGGVSASSDKKNPTSERKDSTAQAKDSTAETKASTESDTKTNDENKRRTSATSEQQVEPTEPHRPHPANPPVAIPHDISPKCINTDKPAEMTTESETDGATAEITPKDVPAVTADKPRLSVTSCQDQENIRQTKSRTPTPTSINPPARKQSLAPTVEVRRPSVGYKRQQKGGWL